MNDPAVIMFARLARALYLLDNRAGEKLLRSVRFYAMDGACDSNADEDSVCGGICSTCKRKTQAARDDARDIEEAKRDWEHVTRLDDYES